MRASSTRARWSIRSLICSPRTASPWRPNSKERDARVAGALHTLTLLDAGHHAAHATPVAA
jgi:hypothetical protein